jgi:hypothetical protein
VVCNQRKVQDNENLEALVAAVNVVYEATCSANEVASVLNVALLPHS